MAERVSRPTTQSIYHVFQQLFHSSFTLSKLRDVVGQGQLFASLADGAIGIPGRSLAWKLFLLNDKPLELPPDEVPGMPIESLRRSRKQFSEELLEKMRAPDGSYDESFVVPGLTIPRRKTQLATDLTTNNPLSLHDENPWRTWFAAVDLRKTIQQDVERTFPDMEYFRDEDIQHQLTNVLFLYCQKHPEIGYRQGMHELLAPLFYAIDYDSIAESDSLQEPLFSELCSRSWVAADSWALFCSLMRNISHWYEWQEPPSSPSMSQGPINMRPYISPIIQTCNNVQGTLLKSVDPVLYDALQSAGVEPQMYGLRWLRLLFTREFPMSEAMMLWDGLFASSYPIAEIAQWTCVAMLIRIRTKLIASDYSTQLMHLLRYPSCPAHGRGASHHILLLVRQATALEILRTPSAGASLAMENRNLLNIPLEVPEPSPVVRRRARPIERSHQMTNQEHASGSPPTESLRQQPSFQLGFPELIARGLLDRGESLGINKTVMNAVSELKRSLPDLASTLVRPTSSSVSSYPLLDERTPTEKQAWDQRGEIESARELAELRQQNKHLGEAVGCILETLSREVDDQDGQEALEAKKKQSLQSLTYVRDVLSGQISDVDERRLWGEEEFKRRWEARETSPPVPGSPLANRRTSLNASLPPSVHEAMRGFISSKVSATPDHNRSASSGTPVVSRATLPRAPVRVSANNPFQRASDGGNVAASSTQWSVGSNRTQVVGSEVRRQVPVQQQQRDPLGVLR